MGASYVSRGYALITGSVIDGTSGPISSLPYYNAQWGSNYTASNGFPLDSLSGYGWRPLEVVFTKTQVSTTQALRLTLRSAYLGSSYSLTNDQYNWGVNIPKSILIRSGQIDSGPATFVAPTSWGTWFRSITKDTNTTVQNSSVDGVTGNWNAFNENVYGPLNCVNFHWAGGTPSMKLAIRDIYVILLSEDS
jgi:hypothetical protein